MIPVSIIGGIAMLGVMFILQIFGFINFWTILLTGKRNKDAYTWTLKVSKWTAHIQMYLAGATDERPSLTPC